MLQVKKSAVSLEIHGEAGLLLSPGSDFHKDYGHFQRPRSCKDSIRKHSRSQIRVCCSCHGEKYPGPETIGSCTRHQLHFFIFIFCFFLIYLLICLEQVRILIQQQLLSRVFRSTLCSCYFQDVPNAFGIFFDGRSPQSASSQVNS